MSTPTTHQVTDIVSLVRIMAAVEAIFRIESNLYEIVAEGLARQMGCGHGTYIMCKN